MLLIFFSGFCFVVVYSELLDLTFKNNPFIYLKDTFGNTFLISKCSLLFSGFSNFEEAFYFIKDAISSGFSSNVLEFCFLIYLLSLELFLIPKDWIFSLILLIPSLIQIFSLSI